MEHWERQVKAEFVNYHPVFLALHGKRILIVGGGNVAIEKLESLLGTGAHITVISPSVHERVHAWGQEGAIVWIEKRFEESDVEDYFMVIAATDDPEVNSLVFRTGDQKCLLSNSVDDPVNCNFIMSAITRQGPMQIAVSSAGCSPALAQKLRKRIANEILSPEVGKLGEFLGSHRPLVKAKLVGYKQKQAFWESVIASDLPFLLDQEGWDAAADEFNRQLAAYCEEPPESLGKVTLVGAGPGDPELMTLKGLNALQDADVVLYDRLTNPKMLKWCGSHALLVDVGKAPGECGRPRQETINALLIEHARRGHKVVRLKGGDPFVFGRGGEEVLALREAGVHYEIIPGVSSCIAAAGAAEIPVTHRGMATGFAVFTAQGAAKEVETVPWHALKELDTIVLMMGAEQLPSIMDKLSLIGRSSDTPVAVISHATLPSEQVVIGTISTITTLARSLPSPATIVIGEVAVLAKGYEHGAAESQVADGSMVQSTAGNSH